MRERLKQLPRRQLGVMLILFILSFAIYISKKLGLELLYCAVFPCALYAVGRDMRARLDSRDPGWRWALAACAVLLVCLMINGLRSVPWSEVVELMLPFAVCMLYMQFSPEAHTLKDVCREFTDFATMLTALYTPFVLVGLFSLFTGRVIRLPLISDTIGLTTAGSYTDRLTIFMHPNAVAQYNVYILFFCLFFLYRRKKLWQRIALGLVMAVNFVCLAHTQSRTCNIALTLGLALMLFFRLRDVQLGTLKGAAGWIVKAAVSAGAALCAFALISLIYKFDVAHLSRAAMQNVSTRAEDFGQLDVVSTGRGAIWSSALRYYRAHPLKLLTGIGVDYVNIIGAEFPAILPYRSLHNSFLSCLVLGGLPFLCCILGLLWTLVRPVLSMLTGISRSETPELLVIPVLVIMMFAMSQVESMLYINPYVNPCYQNLWFFLLCGYARAFARSLPPRKA